jgi:hypothetical protein
MRDSLLSLARKKAEQSVDPRGSLPIRLFDFGDSSFVVPASAGISGNHAVTWQSGFRLKAVLRTKLKQSNEGTR